MSRLEAELKQAESVLPHEFRLAYDRIMKSKGSDGMAEVEGECCGGCFQRLTPNIFNQLVMSQAVFCPSCGRLMYLPEDRTPSRK